MKPVSSLLVALLATAVASAVPAQGDLGKQIIGTWLGPYQAEQVPPGSLKLVVAKDTSGWKVTMDVISDDPPAVGEVREFKIEVDQVSWVQDIAEMECRAVAKMVGGALKGQSECTQGGAVTVTATWVLLKQ
jgi:hypothetical protein